MRLHDDQLNSDIPDRISSTDDGIPDDYDTGSCADFVTAVSICKYEHACIEQKISANLIAGNTTEYVWLIDYVGLVTLLRHH